MRIGTFIDKEGNTLPLNALGTIYVYEDNRDCLWTCVEEIPFCINPEMDIKEIRRRANEVTPRLRGCKALILDNCVGILNCIFEDQLHVRLIMISGDPFPYFDGVKNCIRQNALKAIERVEREQAENRSLSPVPVGGEYSGLYRIDLVKALERTETANLKDILLSFLEKTDFVELEIVCSQTPKWMERKLENLNFKMTTEMRKDGFCHAFVYPCE